MKVIHYRFTHAYYRETDALRPVKVNRRVSQGKPDQEVACETYHTFNSWGADKFIKRAFV